MPVSTIKIGTLPSKFVKGGPFFLGIFDTFAAGDRGRISLAVRAEGLMAFSQLKASNPCHGSTHGHQAKTG